MVARGVPLRYLIFGVLMTIALSLGFNSQNFAYGVTQQNQFESHTITGEDLKNNPFAAKILSEIEYSKKQIAELEKNQREDRKSTRLNSSHANISYAVFCLKKKTKL